MIRQPGLRIAVLAIFGGLVAGCSETGFQDVIGAGKYTPDETQVSVNQPLSVPPDLQLRPPSNEEPQRTARLPQEAAAAPAQPSAQSSGQPQPQQPQQLQQPQPQQQATVAEPQDAYARAGVSRYHPDGREKTQIELNEEMRQKKVEAERQKDPNYGTIWNLGSVWGDG